MAGAFLGQREERCEAAAAGLRLRKQSAALRRVAGAEAAPPSFLTEPQLLTSSKFLRRPSAQMRKGGMRLGVHLAND